MNPSQSRSRDAPRSLQQASCKRPIPPQTGGGVEGGWYGCYLLLCFGERMSQVTVGENEGIESALRRFKRSVAKAGIFSDLRRIRHHETPVEKYKRKLKQRSRNRRR